MPQYAGCTTKHDCHALGLGHRRSMCAMPSASFVVMANTSSSAPPMLPGRCECSADYWRNVNSTADTYGAHDPAADCSVINGPGHFAVVVQLINALLHLATLLFAVQLAVKLKHGSAKSCLKIRTMLPIIQSIVLSLSTCCFELTAFLKPLLMRDSMCNCPFALDDAFLSVTSVFACATFMSVSIPWIQTARNAKLFRKTSSKRAVFLAKLFAHGVTLVLFTVVVVSNFVLHKVWVAVVAAAIVFVMVIVLYLTGAIKLQRLIEGKGGDRDGDGAVSTQPLSAASLSGGASVGSLANTSPPVFPTVPPPTSPPISKRVVLDDRKPFHHAGATKDNTASGRAATPAAADAEPSAPQRTGSIMRKLSRVSPAITRKMSAVTIGAVKTMKTMKAVMQDVSENDNLAMVLLAARRIVLWLCLAIVGAVIYAAAEEDGFGFYLYCIGRFVLFFAMAGGNLSVLLYYQTGIHRQFKIRNQLRKRSSLDRILTFKLGSRTGSRSGRIAPVNEFKEGEEGEEGAQAGSMKPPRTASTKRTDAIAAALAD